MFQQLQDYFFQYKTVVIPGVGMLRMEQQPANLDMANQVLLPPLFEIKFTQQTLVPQHQLQSLAAAYDNNTDIVQEQLVRFGEAFKGTLQQQPFHWNGVGVLELGGNNIQFVPNGTDKLLLPVAAQRVLRENVQHTVLVGDQEMKRTAEAYEAEISEKKFRAWSVIIGWIIALIALAFLGYYFYNSNRVPEASGLQQKPVVEDAPVQYR